jgi:two-component system nitrate/nitrite response regulator NarL
VNRADTGRIKVVVADDDAQVRAALIALLRTDRRFAIVAELDEGTTLAETVRRTDADVVLLDVRMPGGGAAAARSLQGGPPVVVVAISAETSSSTVAEMVGAGAQGYLAKGRLDAGLPEAVARCVAGEVILAVPTAGQALRRLTHAH